MHLVFDPNVKHFLFRLWFYGMFCCSCELVFTVFDFGGTRHREKYASALQRLRHLFHLNYGLEGYTTIWAFFAYSLAMIFGFEPIHNAIWRWPMFIRGGIYLACFYIGEFLFVIAFIGATKRHPWRYKPSWLAPKGLVHFGYAPAWFVMLLLTEQVHNFLLFHVKF